MLAAVKADLPIALNTLFVSSVGDTLYKFEFEVESDGGVRQFVSEWNHHVDAIGYDDLGAEYQLRLTFTPQSVTFQP
jgi:hypothetical protein